MATVAAADRSDNVFVNLLRDRRIVLSVLLTAAIATYFWTQSRYPALNEKAAMGGDTNMSGIAFDEILEWVPNSSFAWELTVNTVNWIYTNWKGMTFGVLFAACALTLLGLIERRGFNNRFANAALGAAIGTPLGVCVNCAAPIARGLHSAGMRLETTLSALIASPTLNVIVVSMSFALLPLHLATLKLVGALAFVLIGVPILTRIFHPKGLEDEAIAKMQGQVDDRRGWIARKLEALRPLPVPASDVDSWPKAFVWLASTFGRNLAFIIAVTVPLMLLAGALGSLLITVFDFEEFRRAIGVPTSTVAILLTMCAIALLGIFLPVPIAFDIILAVILISSGWPARYVMPLLFALGCYSVYSYMIVGRAISWRISTALALSLAGMAVLTGVAANYIDKSIVSAQHRANIAFVEGIAVPSPPEAIRSGASIPPSPRSATPVAFAPLGGAVSHRGEGRIETVTSSPMSNSGAEVGKGFARLFGPEIGIDVAPFPLGYETIEPFTFYWPIASGDFDGDGWVDLAIGRDPSIGGIELFRNVGGTFAPVALDLGPFEDKYIGTIYLTDINGDDAPDLFFSAYLEGTYIVWNRGGAFDWSNRVKLPNGEAGLVGAPGFADIDGDGRLDILAANWTIGTSANNGNPFLLSSTDRIFWNDGDRFTTQVLDGVPGESLTSLIADIDGDKRPDIVIGDDVSTADKIYMNQGGRNFRLMRKSDNIVPYLTNTSMSLDLGDLDNDLVDELYVAQIAWHAWRVESRAPGVDTCRELGLDAEGERACFVGHRERALVASNAHAQYSRCEEISDPVYRGFCAARSLVFRASYFGDTSDCALLGRMGSDLVDICNIADAERYPDAREVMREQDYVGGIRKRNILFRRQADGSFADETMALGVDRPGWSWNSRFVDLDQDGWQDIFVGSGMASLRRNMSNAYYRNRGEGPLGREEEAFGLADEIPTTSYALIDYDRDGDVDIIRPSVLSQPIVHRNDAPAGKALWVRLDDRVGNRQGVGARIVVTTDDGISRARDIRQSGGFATGIDPVAHFGLGMASHVSKIEVTWRDGAKTSIDGEFAPNSEIIVRRSR